MKGDDSKRSTVKSFTQKKKPDIKYIIKITIAAVTVSLLLTFLSDLALTVSHIVISVIILIIFISVGVLFDIIGLATATADERPFHAMAARNIKGAALAIKLIKNAEKVSNICNDVVGDIAGIVSGSAGAALAVKIGLGLGSSMVENVFSIVISALIAGLTIGGKAFGKTIAINHCNTIIYNFSLFLSYFGVK
ncbi:MAG: hypothetical protein E7480_06640 [Ruminococcaceae bacterium]|nr:hypothetical protein [Oscillospiraceae bacterium]